jgi:hypothetical protein
VKYVWIFATIGAIAAGVWVWRGRDRPAAAPPAPSAARGTAAAAPPVATATIDAGAIAVAPAPLPVPAQPGTPSPPPPEAPPVAGGDSLPFDREARDPGWAVDQERELKVRMTHVGELLADRGAKVEVK